MDILILFQVKNRSQTCIYWVCSVRDCKAKATTFDGILVSNTANHIHPPDNTILLVSKQMQNICKRCRDEVTPIPTFYDEEIATPRDADWDDAAVETVENVSTFQSCKTSLYRQRGKLRPLISQDSTGNQPRMEVDRNCDRTAISSD